MHVPKIRFLIATVSCLWLVFGAMGIAHGQGVFGRDLRLGSRGEDVRRLQAFLNTHEAPVSSNGPGSVGNETEYFGTKTRRALAVFQERYRETALKPSRSGTGNFLEATRAVANAILEGEGTATAAIDGASITDSSSGERYRVGGTATGVSVPIMVEEMSGETVRIEPGASAGFVFSHEFTRGDRYGVTVRTVGSGPQSCYVPRDASGVIAGASVLSLRVQCVAHGMGNPFEIVPAGGGAERHALGGTVAGLSGALELQTGTGDVLSLTGDGPFLFGTKVAKGDAYLVTVRTQPSGPRQTCVVSNGSGTVGNADVASVSVTCETNRYALIGSSNGLAGTLVLKNNGGDSLVLTGDGPFAFGTGVADGSAYAVTVFSQPTSPNQVCTVTHGSGTIDGADITDVDIECVTETHAVGGTIAGLVGTVSLRNNGGDSLSRSSNGAFAFSVPVTEGVSYNVTVSVQPASQTCLVVNGSGTMGSGAVTNVSVTCSSNVATVTHVSPNAGMDSGGESVMITGTGFTDATAVRFGSVDAASFTVINDTTIVATSPAQMGGVVHITVTTPAGISATTSADQYVYFSLA